ncbi:ABC transporter ATP-binding protein [Georgenia sp. TF02-10]|uniref:ABC transporter ATP-binding protein n=1 Tax=Georgenia sp. TF02-10 TaxID=2917725 RepID=UPI001FA7AA52|nr:ABC transporter ATP-binding protein [Georgenia sp. TF02-10]UNX53685.1 ABC transporter ATP-binding protein [Georgenia sp. TF02-10]
MISFTDLSVTYDGAPAPALAGVHATIEEGELCLVVGPTGAGKSTLLGAACARVPHFTGGLVQGEVRVAGRDTRTHLPRDLSDVVGVVGQDPLASFVTDTVEEELAFGLEQQGLPPATMRKRVEEVLDLLGLAPLRGRPLTTLSGGEQQRVAIGAVLTAQPRVLVLDEPTSALDPTAAEEVLAALARLVHDVGVTVLLAEHRLERVVQFADTVLALDDGGRAVHGDPARVLAAAPVAPPVVELGRLAGWDPLPLSVRDARRRAAPLRARLTDGARLSPAARRPAGPAHPAADALADGPTPADPPVLAARDLVVQHGPVTALRRVNLTVRAGEVVAVMGRNGAGKSSLVWALQGQARASGTVRVRPVPEPAREAGPTRPAPDPGKGGPGPDPGKEGPGPDLGADPARLRPSAARHLVTLVPQTPSDLLFRETVAAECAAGDTDAAAPAGTTHALLETIAPGVPDEAHPRDLSEGQRLALALAVQLAAAPAVVLLDEPTRGLDYAAKDRLTAVLTGIADAGRAVLVTSHDVEFLAGCADRVVLLADGEVVADGAADEVLLASPAFAPQVAKILAPVPLLTVAQVRAALGAEP